MRRTLARHKRVPGAVRAAAQGRANIAAFVVALPANLRFATVASTDAVRVATSS
jgi:hypothetical protein